VNNFYSAVRTCFLPVKGKRKRYSLSTRTKETCTRTKETCRSVGRKCRCTASRTAGLPTPRSVPSGINAQHGCHGPYRDTENDLFSMIQRHEMVRDAPAHKGKRKRYSLSTRTKETCKTLSRLLYQDSENLDKVTYLRKVVTLTVLSGIAS
jgi:hypothetical protein